MKIPEFMKPILKPDCIGCSQGQHIMLNGGPCTCCGCTVSVKPHVWSQTPETFDEDWQLSMLLYGQVLITNAGPGGRPIVIDPTKVQIKP